MPTRAGLPAHHPLHLRRDLTRRSRGSCATGPRGLPKTPHAGPGYFRSADCGTCGTSHSTPPLPHSWVARTSASDPLLPVANGRFRVGIFRFWPSGIGRSRPDGCWSAARIIRISRVDPPLLVASAPTRAYVTRHRLSGTMTCVVDRLRLRSRQTWERARAAGPAQACHRKKAGREVRLVLVRLTIRVLLQVEFLSGP
jgi:hypothetical protein